MQEEPLLLHICCAPCATACTVRVAAHPTTLFFYNPNIEPREEYDRRLAAARAFAAASGLTLVVGEYDVEAWRAAVAGLEDEPEGGARCRACFAFRLARAAREAARRGCPLFTTSLTVSPHKRSSDVFAAGEVAGQPGTAFLAEDFKKRDGYRLSVERTRALGLYRQSTCGCRFSERPAAWRKKD